MPLNLINLDDLERQNNGFYGFLFQEQIAPKLIDIDVEKLRI